MAHDQALNGDDVRLGVLTVLEEWLFNPKSAVLDGKSSQKSNSGDALRETRWKSDEIW